MEISFFVNSKGVCPFETLRAHGAAVFWDPGQKKTTWNAHHTQWQCHYEQLDDVQLGCLFVNIASKIQHKWCPPSPGLWGILRWASVFILFSFSLIFRHFSFSFSIWVSFTLHILFHWKKVYTVETELINVWFVIDNKPKLYKLFDFFDSNQLSLRKISKDFQNYWIYRQKLHL